MSDIELVDYNDDEQVYVPDQRESKTGSNSYHSSAFRDFLLKPELLRAICDCGFEHPSPVQQQCIPQAMIGMDVIGQAKSGTGKTAVFVLSVLHQINPEPNAVDTLVVCHTRELAFQITQEFERFGKYLPQVKTRCFFGGLPIIEQKKLLQQETPHIVVGTPGRLLELVRQKALNLSKLKRFVMDECDHLLSSIEMRKDIQAIFRSTPLEKQVMLFSATLPADIRPVAKHFTHHAIEVFVDDGSLLTLHGLQQYYVKVGEANKNRKLADLLDALEFNQVVIFVNSVARCRQLSALLNENNFPSLPFHGSMSQDERITTYTKFKDYQNRILVSTDIFGRGVDFERVNVVINYDMPTKPEPYLHRVGRSGRFETKGLAISFISTSEEVDVMNAIQGAFEVQVNPLPDEIDTATYM